MPTYDYGCDRCGPFSASRPMAEFAAPQDCPSCGEPAPRIVLRAPALGAGTAPPGVTAAPPRMHPGGCRCCAAPSRGFSAEAV